MQLTCRCIYDANSHSRMTTSRMTMNRSQRLKSCVTCSGSSDAALPARHRADASRLIHSSGTGRIYALTTHFRSDASKKPEKQRIGKRSIENGADVAKVLVYRAFVALSGLRLLRLLTARSLVRVQAGELFHPLREPTAILLTQNHRWSVLVFELAEFVLDAPRIPVPISLSTAISRPISALTAESRFLTIPSSCSAS